jgi:enamine deaminase RidA (YjgF/YER057c/UK114 family)
MEFKDQVITDYPIVKRVNDYLHTSEYSTSEYSVLNIIVSQCPDGMLNLLRSTLEYLLANNYKIANQFLFGSTDHEKENRILADTYFGGLNWPISVIKQEKINGESTWSTVITGVKSESLKPVYDGKAIVGNSFLDQHASYCYLAGILPQATSDSNKSQSIFTLKKIDKMLKSVEMNFNNVVRTWFYLNDLLLWYDDFNSARNEYFFGKNVFDTIMPASTGIGANNFNNSALLGGAYAVRANDDKVTKIDIPSPLQCPANEYQSSFSRAVETNHPEYRHLFISGTASITCEGKTANKGNISKQIDLTMKVVNAIIESREMNWDNIIRGIAYFKDINNKNIFQKYCEDNMLPNLPVTMVQADICREDLLFEIEIDALTINKYI